MRAGQREKEMGRVQVDEDGDDDDSSGEESQDLRKLLAERTRIPELAPVEGGVTEKDDEGVDASGPQNGERRDVGDEVKEESEGQRKEEGCEFDGQEEVGMHRGGSCERGGEGWRGKAASRCFVEFLHSTELRPK